LLFCRKLPTAARIRTVLDTGAALEGVLPSDYVPSHSVFFGAGGCAEYAIDAWLYTSAREYGREWWNQDEVLQGLPEYEALDGNFGAVAAAALPLGWKRHTVGAVGIGRTASTEVEKEDEMDGSL
jgi:hypothetical protein